MATPATSGITARLTEFTLSTRYEDLAPEVIAEARNSLMDTLGVALIGSREHATRAILKVSTDGTTGGTATVLGTDTRAAPTVAAAVNGYAAHALDYDDTQHRLSGHMSAPVTPAALVISEMRHRSGKDLLMAYLVGFEVACRLGRAAAFATHLNKRGIHATGYLGHFGAAAAAARLAGLDAATTRSAFGIAAGHASGIVKSFGTMGKAQNAGNAAQNGVLAALLAELGFTGPTEMFDGKNNIFFMCGAETNEQEMFDGLGTQFEVTTNTLKIFACAGWRNPIVEAAMALTAAHNLKAGDVESMKVSACTGVAHLPNYPVPRTGLESKFSAEFAASVAVIDHAGGVQQFCDARIADAAVIDLTRRTTLEYDPALGPYQIRLAINTRDGRKLSHFVPCQKGDHENPMSWNELLTKFRANASAVLPDKQVDELALMLERIESVHDVADLTRLCRPAGR